MANQKHLNQSMNKIYKPGQIVTIDLWKFQLVKVDIYEPHCSKCDLYKTNIFYCRRYCYRRHNDFDKCPGGYVLRKIPDVHSR